MLGRGFTILFAWGPPWHWLPRAARSEHGWGLSVVWLWFGIYFVPKPVGLMLVGGPLFEHRLRQEAALMEDLTEEAAS